MATVGFMAWGASHLLGSPPELGDSATTINSGSTNRPGFRIVVDRSGAAEFASVSRRSGAPTARTVSTRQTLPHTRLSKPSMPVCGPPNGLIQCPQFIR